MLTPTAFQATRTITLSPLPTSTTTSQITNTPSISPHPTSTPANIAMIGTPLPLKRNLITTESINDIQKLATWGTGCPNDIQLSKDGQVLAVGTSIGTYFYDSLGYEELAFRESPHSVISIAFSSDNKSLALGQYGGNIDIYDRYSNTLISRLRFPTSSLPKSYTLNLFFYQEDSLLIGIIETKKEIFIHQWETNNWQTENAFSINNGLGSFINDEIGLIGIVRQDKLVLQSMLYEEEVEFLPLPDSLTQAYWDQFSIYEGDILPAVNGDFLLINDGTAILYWEIQSEDISYKLDNYPSALPDPCLEAPATCLNKLGEISWSCQDTPTPPIETIALTPDDAMVLISRNDNILEFRRASDGLFAWKIDAQYTRIRFSPGSEFFFGLREDGLVEKRNTMDGELLGLIDNHPCQLYDVEFSPDSNIVAASLNLGIITRYKVNSGQNLSALEGIATALDFSSDGALLAAGLMNGTIRIFNLEMGQHFDIAGHMDSVTDLRFSSDGQDLLSGSRDCTISLWDVNYHYRKELLIPEKDTPFRVIAVEFSPVIKNQYLVGNMDSVFVVSETIQTPLLPTILTSDIALSQNEQTLAVAGKNTWLFREINHEAFASPIKLSTQGNALTLSNDGSLLIVGTSNTLEFWSVETASKLHTIPVIDPEVLGNKPASLTISPDDTMIALGYQNGLIDIYGIPEN